MREQMNNYKQMRRQHYRQLQQVVFGDLPLALFDQWFTRMPVLIRILIGL